MKAFSLSGICMDRRFLVSNGVALAALVIVSVFPQHNLTESIVLSLGALVIFPIGFVLLILRENISHYGISWGRKNFAFNGILVFFAVAVFMAFVWAIASTLPSFLPTVPSVVRSNFGAFLSFVAISALLNGASCFFFQGFLLSVWTRRYGWLGIPIISAFFVCFLVLKNGGTLESSLIISSIWSLCATGVSFFSASAPVSFGFLLFSDILFTAFLIFRT